MMENGSWTGGIGVLQRKEADVVSVLMGMNPQRCSVIDCSLPTLRDPITLISSIPKGINMNIWVYVRVFGVIQWAIFLLLLIGCVILLILSHKRRNKGTESQENIVVEAITTMYLFTLQLGDHVSTKYLGTRLLMITASMLTLLMFVYYTTDITAEMTSGNNKIPVRTFEDVLYYDYEVVVPNEYYRSILASSEPGTAKYEVYKKYLENGTLGEWEDIIADHKTLMYARSSSIVQAFTLVDDTKHDEMVALKMDDSAHVMSAFGLQADSEFRELLNYYLLKEIEHGIMHRLDRRWYRAKYVKEQFGISEPQPLGYENVIFTFACLGIGILISLGMTFAELIHRPRKKVAHF